MANFEYGAMKVRGTKENILKFIQHFEGYNFELETDLLGEDITEDFKFSVIFLTMNTDEIIEDCIDNNSHVAKDGTIYTGYINIIVRYSSERDVTRSMSAITEKCNVDVKGYINVYCHASIERFISTSFGKYKFKDSDMPRVICGNCRCDDVYVLGIDDSTHCSMCDRKLIVFDTYFKPMSRKRKKWYNTHYFPTIWNDDVVVRSKKTKNGRKSFFTRENTRKDKHQSVWDATWSKIYRERSLRMRDFKVGRKVIETK